MKITPIIGLEVHVELKTKSKMFCGCPAKFFGKKPNSQTCPVCLGLPGALPVPNRKAVEWTILIGKALDCRINPISKFDRKHYFYPDLPKGYQISQYDEPIANKGWLKLKTQISNLKTTVQNSKLSNNVTMKQSNNEFKTFRIRRVHLEEDTGKLLHVGGDTLVDFNRSGVPLVEIVTEPDFDNADDVKRFLEELQVIIRYLGVSDADMEKGSMRLEPNISVSQDPSSKFQVPNKFKIQNSKIKQRFWTSQNDNLPNYKVEVKNINSFRFVKQAIEYEVERQVELLEKGITPEQETRGFNEKKGVTYGQRSKEEAHDYRYFPEPDIPPMSFSKRYLDTISVPELPQQKMDRYIKNFEIKESAAFMLTRDRDTATFFENVIAKVKSKKSIRSTSSGLILSKVEVSKIHIKDQKYEQTIANIIINKKLSISMSADLFVEKALELLAPKETDEKLLDTTINHLIGVNKKAIEDFRKGKENAIMFLVGQVMREMKGKADAKLVKDKLLKKLIIK